MVETFAVSLYTCGCGYKTTSLVMLVNTRKENVDTKSLSHR